MMSMGGGWFFLVAAEAISVLNQSYTLPGVGAYAGAAIAAGDLGKVALAIVTMAVMVIGVNFLLWSPLVAWSEKFKNEQSEAAEVPRSAVLNFLRRSHWPRAIRSQRVVAWLSRSTDSSSASSAPTTPHSPLTNGGDGSVTPCSGW